MLDSTRDIISKMFENICADRREADNERVMSHRNRVIDGSDGAEGKPKTIAISKVDPCLSKKRKGDDLASETALKRRRITQAETESKCEVVKTSFKAKPQAIIEQEKAVHASKSSELKTITGQENAAYIPRPDLAVMGKRSGYKGRAPLSPRKVSACLSGKRKDDNLVSEGVPKKHQITQLEFKSRIERRLDKRLKNVSKERVAFERKCFEACDDLIKRSSTSSFWRLSEEVRWRRAKSDVVKLPPCVYYRNIFKDSEGIYFFVPPDNHKQKKKENPYRIVRQAFIMYARRKDLKLHLKSKSCEDEKLYITHKGDESAFMTRLGYKKVSLSAS